MFLLSLWLQMRPRYCAQSPRWSDRVWGNSDCITICPKSSWVPTMPLINLTLQKVSWKVMRHKWPTRKHYLPLWAVLTSAKSDISCTFEHCQIKCPSLPQKWQRSVFSLLESMLWPADNRVEHGYTAGGIFPYRTRTCTHRNPSRVYPYPDRNSRGVPRYLWYLPFIFIKICYVHIYM